jgi:hypothetical protein
MYVPQLTSPVSVQEQLSDTDVFHVGPSLWYAESQDGAVLVDFHQNVRVLLNPIGVMIFKRLKEGEAVGKIANALVAEFAMPKQQIYEDVSQFIGDLRAKRLLFSTEEIEKSTGGRSPRKKRRMEWVYRWLLRVRGC